MAKPVPIPPKGLLLTAHEIKRVAFGWDVTIKLQSIDLTEGLSKDEITAIAWIQLGGWMRAQGIDVEGLMQMIRDG